MLTLLRSAVDNVSRRSWCPHRGVRCQLDDPPPVSAEPFAPKEHRRFGRNKEWMGLDDGGEKAGTPPGMRNVGSRPTLTSMSSVSSLGGCPTPVLHTTPARDAYTRTDGRPP